MGKKLELIEYLEHITAELPLPLYLYNMPSFTKMVFEPKTIRATADLEGIAGLKVSGDMIYFHQLKVLLKDYPEFSLLTG